MNATRADSQIEFGEVIFLRSIVIRTDMQKVLVERPRIGSRWNNDYKGKKKAFQKLRVNEDYCGKRESSARGRRPYWTQKELNENLKPLFRFLEGKVGKFWDKVYSEIRKNINPANAVQLHILQHLEWYVCTDAIEVSKGVFKDSKGLSIGDPFFVNPKTGCLARNDDSHYFRDHYRRKPQPPLYTRVGDRTFKEIEGIWYEIGLQTMPKVKPNLKWYERESYSDPQVVDAVTRLPITYSDARKLYGGSYYATMKRQLNSHEIRKMRLVHSEQKAA